MRSALLLTAAIILSACIGVYKAIRQAQDVPLRAEQLRNLMFVEASDGVKFTGQCGRNWQDIFREWERVQQRALIGDVTARAIVWTCEGTCGGLGDRQRGILTSFMLALVTGRAFFIQSETPVPLRHYFHIANPSLHWTLEGAYLEGRTVLRENFLNGLPPIGDFATSNLTHYDSYDFVFQSNNFWQPFHILRNPSLKLSQLVKQLRRYDDHVLAGCLLNYLLVPAREIQSTLLQVRQSVKRQHHRLLAVQIRTGDSQNKNATVLAEFIQLFQQCVKKLEQLSPAPLEVFLTTDSSEILEIFREAHPKLLTFAGEIYHVDGPFGAPTNPDTAFRKLVLDHLMISQADELLISRSGFSEYAAVRGFKPFYTPANCDVGNPTPHFTLPTSQPSGISGEDIHSVNVMLETLAKDNSL